MKNKFFYSISLPYYCNRISAVIMISDSRSLTSTSSQKHLAA